MYTLDVCIRITVSKEWSTCKWNQRPTLQNYSMTTKNANTSQKYQIYQIKCMSIHRCIQCTVLYSVFSRSMRKSLRWNIQHIPERGETIKVEKQNYDDNSRNWKKTNFEKKYFVRLRNFRNWYHGKSK